MDLTPADCLVSQPLAICGLVICGDVVCGSRSYIEQADSTTVDLAAAPATSLTLDAPLVTEIDLQPAGSL